MMKKITALFLLLIYASASFACSTFLLNKDGRLVFGRNYDWVTGNGIVVVNARGVQKTSLVVPGEKTVSWVSKCGSVTFNQYGKEFPHGGMNEAGLVVELMWLTATVYPGADDRAAMNELQWIQYQLDNFASVEEVIKSNEHIRISPQGGAPLHFLVADAAGNAATIEFIKGKMVVHQGKDLSYPVLTNTIYKDAVQQMKRSSSNDNSVERFATACRMVEQFQSSTAKEDAVDYAFSMLDEIAQGDFTKWRIAYDITNRKVYFTTGKKRKQIALKDFDFSCNPQSLYFDINSGKEGNVSAQFSALSFEKNEQVLKQSVKESQGYVTITEQSLSGAIAYFNQVPCSNK
jgi:choloylglycine hydrolase